jgi:N-acetyl-gamma-glutamyl-phosphate reductase
MQHEHPRIKVAIFGGSGYGGSELLRILLFHPHVDVVLVTANEHADKRVTEVHKNLHGLTNLSFVKQPETLDGVLDNIDCVFFALPHGQAMSLVPNIPPQVKVIDLSGDFRLRDQSLFESHYKQPHTAMETQAGFVYGLTETNREAVRNARLIANPGCFATATLLGLAPLVANGLLAGRVVVDAKTGSSGSGAKAAANTHHPQRMTSFYAYKPFTHQHVPEIEQELAHVGDWTNELIFMTHSLPVARGIFASIYVELKRELSAADFRGLFSDFYRESFLVRFFVG